MKKILLILVLFVVGLTSTAQSNLDSTALVTYQITDTVVQNPDGTSWKGKFYISITGFDLNRDGDFYFVCTTRTYKDTLNVRNIKNADLNSSKRYYVTKSQLASFTLIQIFNNTVKPDYENIWGAGNVGKLN